MSSNVERAERLLAAAMKIRSRIDANPKHPNADRWQAKLVEYEVSLNNLQRFGVENPGAGRAGVEVAIPKGLFGVVSQNPGD